MQMHRLTHFEAEESIVVTGAHTDDSDQNHCYNIHSSPRPHYFSVDALPMIQFLEVSIFFIF